MWGEGEWGGECVGNVVKMVEEYKKYLFVHEGKSAMKRKMMIIHLWKMKENARGIYFWWNKYIEKGRKTLHVNKRIGTIVD